MSLEEIMVIGMFLTFIGLLFTGYPVAWVLGGTAIIWGLIGVISVEYLGADIWFTWNSSVSLVPERVWDIVARETLVALPMFIFMGIMLDRSGVAEQLMKNMVKLFGGIRGGYAVTVVVIGKRLGNYIFPSLCGILMMSPSYINAQGVHHESELIEKSDQPPALA